VEYLVHNLINMYLQLRSQIYINSNIA